MIMSRAKGAAKPASKKESAASKLPQLEEYIKNRDYSGALTLLEFNRRSDEIEEEKQQHLQPEDALLSALERAVLTDDSASIPGEVPVA